MFNTRGPLLANGAFPGVRRIGGTHKLSQVCDGILLLESQNYDRSTRHKISQRIEERLAGVYCIKLLSLMLGDLQHLHGQNMKVVLLSQLSNLMRYAKTRSATSFSSLRRTTFIFCP